MFNIPIYSALLQSASHYRVAVTPEQRFGHLVGDLVEQCVLVDGLVVALDIGFADKAVVAQFGLDVGHGAFQAAMAFDMDAGRRQCLPVLQQSAQ